MTIGIRGNDDIVCGSFGCKNVKSFIELGDELKKKECNHNPMSYRTTLNVFIKRPLGKLTEMEKQEEREKPSFKCKICGELLY